MTKVERERERDEFLSGRKEPRTVVIGNIDSKLYFYYFFSSWM